jgi:hypothetical protein
MIKRGRDLQDVARDRDLLLVGTIEPEHDRKVADEKLCLWLLAGYSVDDGKYGKVGFPKAGSPEESACRAALARTIRDQMRGFNGEFLALAIDPRTPSKWPMVPRAHRSIRFNKPRGRPPTSMRDLLVIDFIKRERGKLGKEDAALLAAEREFGIGKSRTHNIWAGYKQSIGENRKSRRPRHSTN